ncbi:MAG TPA: VOC family protein [Verrucomicrobiae bacterium]|nr:VOC family protein [Verrucomicrobiae bacterium]
MLGRYDVSVSLAVKDIATARSFYIDKLGLMVEKESADEATYSSGHVKLHVYESSQAGSNKATAATWEVENIESEVVELRNLGIEFEHDTNSSTQLEGDIYVDGSEKAAWFKDPDGNVLCLHSGVRSERLDVHLT